MLRRTLLAMLPTFVLTPQVARSAMPDPTAQRKVFLSAFWLSRRQFEWQVGHPALFQWFEVQSDGTFEGTAPWTMLEGRAIELGSHVKEVQRTLDGIAGNNLVGLRLNSRDELHRVRFPLSERVELWAACSDGWLWCVVPLHKIDEALATAAKVQRSHDDVH